MNIKVILLYWNVAQKVLILPTNEQKYEIFIFTQILQSLVTNSLCQKVCNWSVEALGSRLKAESISGLFI